MSEFVDECRSEWRRLGVPDPIANEMAADLSADLDEAAAEGASPEDVLGMSAFDPRRFAAAWAVSRGVTAPPHLAPPPLGRARWAIVVAAVIGALAVVAGLVLMGGRSARSIAMFPLTPTTLRPGFVGRHPERLIAPGAVRIGYPVRVGLRFLRTQSVGADLHPLAWILLIVGIASLAFAMLAWSPWSGARRFRGRREPPTPGWS